MTVQNITCHIAVVRDDITFDTSGNCSSTLLVVGRDPGGLDVIFSHALQERFGLHVKCQYTYTAGILMSSHLTGWCQVR